jgi:hypothetical protein
VEKIYQGPLPGLSTPALILVRPIRKTCYFIKDLPLKGLKVFFNTLFNKPGSVGPVFLVLFVGPVIGEYNRIVKEERDVQMKTDYGSKRLDKMNDGK